ncbi:MAG: glutathione peroxidase [Alteromonas naphthalenivorans]|jgi:glutathione peroxidase
MNKFMLLALALCVLTACNAKKSNAKKAPAKASFYNLKAKDINGHTVPMSKFKGKTILIVNTASKCGYTGQYKELEELYQTFKKDLVILGFPTNDFFGQEPGSNKEIAQFCTRKYNVTFPMFEKTTTKGNDKHDIFDWLTSPSKNGWNKKKVSWNFNKHIIDKNGNLVDRFGSGESPLSKKIKDLIQ